jgi:hypothetical protein
VSGEEVPPEQSADAAPVQQVSEENQKWDGLQRKTTLEIKEFDYQMLEREVLNHMRRNSQKLNED